MSKPGLFIRWQINWLIVSVSDDWLTIKLVSSLTCFFPALEKLSSQQAKERCSFNHQGFTERTAFIWELISLVWFRNAHAWPSFVSTPSLWSAVTDAVLGNKNRRNDVQIHVDITHGTAVNSLCLHRREDRLGWKQRRSAQTHLLLWWREIIRDYGPESKHKSCLHTPNIISKQAAILSHVHLCSRLTVNIWCLLFSLSLSGGRSSSH